MEHRAFEDLLREAGIDAVADERGCRAIVAGRAVRVTHDDETVTMRCVVDGDALGLDPEAVNAANVRVRYARYTIEDGRLVMTCESLASQGTRAAVGLWRLTLHDLDRVVAELALGRAEDRPC